MMDRFAETYLSKWYHKKRRKPLILRGARQVGKSTLARQFAHKNNLELHEINLERYMDMNTIFKTLDIDYIIRIRKHHQSQCPESRRHSLPG